MGSIVNNPFRVYASDQFLQAHKEGGRPLYIAISREAEWTNEHPPRSENTLNERDAFINNMIGLQRVETADIIPVIHKYEWKAGDTDYVVFDNTSTNAVYSKFYTMNSEGRVYQCVTKGSGAVANEPLGHNNGNNITGADGYVWKYFYSLKTGEKDLFKDSLWMPIHFGATYSTQEQKDYGSIYVNIAFGSRHIMLRAKLTDDGIRNRVNFHQFGFISRPTNAAGTQYTAKYPNFTDFDRENADVIHIENHYKKTRNIGKWEKFYTVIEF